MTKNSGKNYSLFH